jgi:1-pyrroline-5-carboxylate dehydrogenase
MDAVTTPPAPINEPNLTYAPGTPERAALELELARQRGIEVELTATIGGEKVVGGGAEHAVVEPHDHAHVLGRFRAATQDDAKAAVEAARKPRRAGQRRASTTGLPSCSRPQSCLPDRGANG